MSNAILEEQMQELWRLKKEEASRCGEIDAMIAQHQDVIQMLMNSRRAVAEDILAHIETAQTVIRNVVIANAATFECTYGKASFKKGYQRRSYEADAIDKICGANETVKALLWPFRKITEIAPTVTIKVEL